MNSDCNKHWVVPRVESYFVSLELTFILLLKTFANGKRFLNSSLAYSLYGTTHYLYEDSNQNVACNNISNITGESIFVHVLRKYSKHAFIFKQPTSFDKFLVLFLKPISHSFCIISIYLFSFAFLTSLDSYPFSFLCHLAVSNSGEDNGAKCTQPLPLWISLTKWMSHLHFIFGRDWRETNIIPADRPL